MKRVLIVLPFIVVVLFVVIWQLSKARSYQVFGDIFARANTKEKVIALTFDDGPWNDKYTHQVLNILGQHNIKATFFLNGKGIEENIEAAKHLAEAGHQIGNHAYSHRRMVFMGLKEVEREVISTSSLIRQIGYTGEIYFRPPYGKKLITLPYYLSSHGITTVTWDIDPERNPTIANNPSALAQHVVDNAKPGSIILLHVLGSKNAASRDALLPIVEGLQAKGFTFVTVAQLLGSESFRTDA